MTYQMMATMSGSTASNQKCHFGKTEKLFLTDWFIFSFQCFLVQVFLQYQFGLHYNCSFSHAHRWKSEPHESNWYWNCVAIRESDWLWEEQFCTESEVQTLVKRKFVCKAKRGKFSVIYAHVVQHFQAFPINTTDGNFTWHCTFTLHIHTTHSSIIFFSKSSIFRFLPSFR